MNLPIPAFEGYVLTYTTDDDGVWLEHESGWSENLGYHPSLNDVLAAAARRELARVGRRP